MSAASRENYSSNKGNYCAYACLGVYARHQVTFVVDWTVRKDGRAAGRFPEKLLSRSKEPFIPAFEFWAELLFSVNTTIILTKSNKNVKNYSKLECVDFLPVFLVSFVSTLASVKTYSNFEI